MMQKSSLDKLNGMVSIVILIEHLITFFKNGIYVTRSDILYEK